MRLLLNDDGPHQITVVTIVIFVGQCYLWGTVGLSHRYVQFESAGGTGAGKAAKGVGPGTGHCAAGGDFLLGGFTRLGHRQVFHVEPAIDHDRHDATFFVLDGEAGVAAAVAGRHAGIAPRALNRERLILANGVGPGRPDVLQPVAHSQIDAVNDVTIPT